MSEQGAGRANTIMLIEDDQDIREAVCELFELEGFRVLVATNSSEGLQLLKSDTTPQPGSKLIRCVL